MVMVAFVGCGFTLFWFPLLPPQPTAANAAKAMAVTSSRRRVRCPDSAAQAIPSSPISNAIHTAGGHFDGGPVGANGADATPVVVTVIVDVPLAVPDSATEAGANEQGKPETVLEQLSVTVPLKPLFGISVIGNAALVPCCTVTEVGVTDMVKPPPAVPTVTTTAAEVDAA